jgi:gamma-hexachlorocyclohexane dehydrochlorinase
MNEGEDRSMNDSTNNLQATVEKLMARVEELESRSEIKDLVIDYCVGFDSKNWDRFMAIWHKDAVWEIGPPFGTFSGHEGISKALHEVLEPAWRETHHISSNIQIEFLDANNARGSSDVDCMGANKNDVVQMVNATYQDEYQRRNGVWKIARRVVTMHYFNAIPGLEMSAP